MNDAPATKDDLLALEQRFDKEFATKDDLSAMKDEIIDAIGSKFQEAQDRFDAAIEHVEHDLIRPLHDKNNYSDEKIDRNTKRIDRLEDLAGIPQHRPLGSCTLAK